LENVGTENVKAIASLQIMWGKSVMLTRVTNLIEGILVDISKWHFLPKTILDTRNTAVTGSNMNRSLVVRGYNNH